MNTTRFMHEGSERSLMLHYTWQIILVLLTLICSWRWTAEAQMADPYFNQGSLACKDPCILSEVVRCFAMQPDGKILVAGGNEMALNGQPRDYLFRVNVDGILDTNFSRAVGAKVCSIALQTDGKILLGGDFTEMGGYIGRVNVNGLRDSSFGGSANQAVRALAVQADKKILLGGFFTKLNGQTRNYCLLAMIHDILYRAVHGTKCTYHYLWF